MSNFIHYGYEALVVRNIKIVNNTCYNNGSFWGGGIAVFRQNVNNIVVRNNICSENRGGQIRIDIPQWRVTSDHNLTTGDPRFVNPANGNFHLRSGSPAIDAGSPNDAPTHDYEGNPRFGAPDIGALETQ